MDFTGHFFFFAFFKWQGYKLHFISDGLMSLVCGPSDAFLFRLSLQPPYDTKRPIQRRENRRGFLSLLPPFSAYYECNPTKGKLPYEGDRGIDDWLSGRKCRFWSHLGYSGKKPIFLPLEVSLRLHWNSLRGRRLEGKGINWHAGSTKGTQGEGKETPVRTLLPFSYFSSTSEMWKSSFVSVPKVSIKAFIPLSDWRKSTSYYLSNLIDLSVQ